MMVIFTFLPIKTRFDKTYDMRNILCIFTLLLFISISFQVNAHKRAKYNIVIDTDGGVDDFRALTYFMSSREFNINAITTVDGVLPPDLSAQYIQQLCDLYHHEGILVGEGKNGKASKQYQSHAMPVWENLFGDIELFSFDESVKLIQEAVNGESKRTIIIALGPLTNISDFVELYPSLKPKIETVLWYSDYDKKPVGYNYEQDKKAYSRLVKAQIPVKMISSDNIAYGKDFLEICSKMKSVYANSIYKAFDNTGFAEGEMYYWDELIPLYLLYPSMFVEESVGEYSKIIKPGGQNLFDILITGVLNFDKPDQGVVFNEVPTFGFMLRNDVLNVVDSLVAKHGYAEFKIAALTSEIHSHMGIYSILGAKTGLRIMEYLHAGLDEIELVSYAGFDPPLSCFNDGLQVGTGSTIGYGTISVDTLGNLSPSVLVRYNQREILFSIKPEVVKEIESDISQLIKSYGLLSDMYWLKLREIAIYKYWLGMSRYDILEVEEKNCLMSDDQ